SEGVRRNKMKPINNVATIIKIFFVVAAVAVVLIAISVASILSGQFKGFVGKSTVLATDTYIGVQDAMASVDVVDRFFERMGSDLRTAKTVLQAGLSLLSSLGETLMLPALAVFLLLTIGVWWYFRSAHRRSTQNASFIV
ncbi:MAG: hypothetical protein JSW58_03090, partial [Candidatus Latescibacterota bacterium]